MGKKRGGGTVLMALGVVLALISGGVVFFIAQTATAAPTEVPRKSIVVARVDIAERTIITKDLVLSKDWPIDVIPAKTILDFKDVENKFAREKIRAGNPILEGQIATKPGEPPPATQPGAAAGAAGPGLGGGKPPPVKQVDAAYILDKGKTLVAVDYPEAAKLITAGLLRPGNKVDIYVRVAAPGGVAGSEQFALLYPNLEIKAIGTLAQTEEAAPSSTLIFMVPLQDAVVLKFLETMNPFLLVRAASDEQDYIKTDVVSLEYIRSKLQKEPKTTPGR